MSASLLPELANSSGWFMQEICWRLLAHLTVVDRNSSCIKGGNILHHLLLLCATVSRDIRQHFAVNETALQITKNHCSNIFSSDYIGCSWKTTISLIAPFFYFYLWCHCETTLLFLIILNACRACTNAWLFDNRWHLCEACRHSEYLRFLHTKLQLLEHAMIALLFFNIKIFIELTWVKMLRFL